MDTAIRSRARRRARITVWSLLLVVALAVLMPLGGHLYVGPSQSSAQPAQTAQPVNPRAEYWRGVRRGDAGYTTVPGTGMDVAIHNGGQNWRQVRNGWVVNYGGWFLVGAFLIIGLFFVLRGPQRIEGGRSGTRVKRWSTLDRTVHWATALMFVILAVTGLSLLFGRAVLIPLFGLNGFSAWAGIAMTLHNYLGPVFAGAVAIMIALWIRHNIPRKVDLEWLAAGGGVARNAHPDAGFANAGEKLWFWFICTVGVVVIVSGLVMDFTNLGVDRRDFQLANVVHATAACMWIALWFGHACIGTIGTEGALEGMTTGYVDERWARQHHKLWLEDAERDGTLVKRAPGDQERQAPAPNAATTS